MDIQPKSRHLEFASRGPVLSLIDPKGLKQYILPQVTSPAKKKHSNIAGRRGFHPAQLIMKLPGIKSPFTEAAIAFAVQPGLPAQQTELPALEAEIVAAVSSELRRIQFAAGRLAARSALRSAGATGDLTILQGEKGEPIWPAGWIGSIAHTGEIAVAAVAPAHRVSGLHGLGVDIEVARRVLRPDLGRRICTQNEIVSLPKDDLQRSFALIRIFSAKEAVYKAVYPLIQQFLEFRDVELDPFDSNGRTSAHLIFIGAPGGLSIQVSAVCEKDFIVTGAEVYSA